MMNKLFFLLLTITAPMSFAVSVSDTLRDDRQLNANIMYQDFRFDADNQGNHFNYSGHTMAARTGVSRYPLAYGLKGGVHLSNINTELGSLLALGSALQNNQLSIENHGVDAELDIPLFSLAYLQIFGGYGQSTYDLFQSVDMTNVLPQQAFSHYHGDNDFLGTRLNVTKMFGKIALTGNLIYFASRFHQNGYTMSYDPAIDVRPLTTKLNTFIEAARMYYVVNEFFLPFVQGELLQISNRRNSRPTLTQSQFIAPLPQATLGNNGYTLGAGVVGVFNKTVMITPSYAYVRRGSNYHANQALLTFQIMMS